MRVSCLVFEGCMSLPPIAAMEMLRKSNGIRCMLTGIADPLFEVELVACGQQRTIAANYGFPVQCDRTLEDPIRTDLVLVPALDGDVLAQLEENRWAVRWLGQAFSAGAAVASMCTGAFVLAEAGLLDGLAATTHWNALALFRRRYPRVRVMPERIVVDEGRVCTSGGATSLFNLILHLVEKYSDAETADFAAKMFLIDRCKDSQSAYELFSPQKDHDDEQVHKAQALIEDLGSRPIGVNALAQHVSISPRHFVRRFKAATGSTPLEYIQRMRVEKAKRGLERSGRSVAQIARDVGYEDLPSFRKIFMRVTGVSPAEYRRRHARPQEQSAVSITQAPAA